MTRRAPTKYTVDVAARIVAVDGADSYEIVPSGENAYEVKRGGRRIGTFEVEPRGDGQWDAFVAAEEGEDVDRIHAVVRTARRNGLAP